MAVRVPPKGKIGEPVLAGWKIKLARLSQMNWDEIRTRAGQELHKRGDLIRYRLGMPPDVPGIASAQTRRPEFFFPTGGAQERADLLRSRMPAAALEIIHRADAIRHHHFDLLGYEHLDYGLVV